MFAVYNRANGSGEQWPLLVDWIYNATDANGQPILTAADKQIIRSVFLIWANDCLNAYTTGGDHPAPIGVTTGAGARFDSGCRRSRASHLLTPDRIVAPLAGIHFDVLNHPGERRPVRAAPVG